MNMILGKRHIILAALVLVLGIAVYLNWTFGGKEGGLNITDQLEAGKITGTLNMSMPIPERMKMIWK